MANGAPKPVVSGRKGNVGGVATPGRSGHALKSGLMILVKPGPATKKTPKTTFTGADDKGAKPDAGNVKAGSGVTGTAKGSPRSLSIGSGRAKGVLTPHNPEGAIGKDSAGAIAHKK